ncbi:cytoplasmic protein [Neobacillus sp. Marseille-QA0830]
MKASHDLKINGSGNYPGGHYDKVRIRGEATIESHVDCSVFNIYGTSEVVDGLQADSIKVIGEAEVKGNLESGSILVVGNMAIEGSAVLNQMKILGTLAAGERLQGEMANVKGSISVNGDVEYETFNLKGGFEIKGLLNADRIEIGLHFGESSVAEIGGEKIIIKRKSSFLPFVKDAGHLSAKVIEGDEVSLENTKAEIVRGKLVKIGKGCDIGIVEYTENLIQEKSATIKTFRKV